MSQAGSAPLLDTSPVTGSSFFQLPTGVLLPLAGTLSDP